MKEKELIEGKKVSDESYRDVYAQILWAIGVIIYFFLLNLAYIKINSERLSIVIELFATVFLLVGLLILERSYKNDSGKQAITAIELFVLSFHSLTIIHFVTKFQFDFQFYVLTSSYILAIYYILKAIFIYTKAKREYLNSLSDIKEIVKKDEPIKKEASKKTKKKEVKKAEIKPKEKNKEIKTKEKNKEIKLKESRNKNKEGEKND